MTKAAFGCLRVKAPVGVVLAYAGLFAGLVWMIVAILPQFTAAPRFLQPLCTIFALVLFNGVALGLLQLIRLKAFDEVSEFTFPLPVHNRREDRSGDD